MKNVLRITAESDDRLCAVLAVNEVVARLLRGEDGGEFTMTTSDGHPVKVVWSMEEQP